MFNMKKIELLSEKRSSDVVFELLSGSNKLKEVKKYFDKMSRKPEFLDETQRNDFFEYIDSVDIKIFETIEEVNRCISFVVHCDLDNNINN